MKITLVEKIRLKMAALVEKDAAKKKLPALPAGMRWLRPLWVRNSLCASAHAIARGRTVNPKARAMAIKWRQVKMQMLSAKQDAGLASLRELRELRRMRT